MGLLRSATAFEAYCKVYTADLTPDRILEFLLLDEEFPHSLRFSIDALQHALTAIDRDSAITRAEPLRRLAGRLQASLSYSSVDEIVQQDIVAYLQSIQAQCRAIHMTILRTLRRLLDSGCPCGLAPTRLCARQNRRRLVLLDSTPYEVPLLQRCKRQHDGNAHAPAQRPEPALPDLPPCRQPALPRCSAIATTWQTMCITSTFRASMGSL